MRGLGSMLGKSRTMEHRYVDEESKRELRRLGRRRERRLWVKEMRNGE
jgi:hypothetical protein